MRAGSLQPQTVGHKNSAQTQVTSIPQICDLTNVPLAVPRLSVLLHEEWGRMRGRSLLEIESVVKGWCRKGEMPWGIVAMAGSEPAGIAVLHSLEFKTRPNLSPWLSSLLIAARYRGRGFGTALVQEVETRAKSLGHDMLYLHTADKASLYRRLHWEAIDTDIAFGRSVVIMRKYIGSAYPISECGRAS